LKVKPDNASYVSEMTATTAAVAVFVAVYVLGFMHTGPLLTLLFGWIPAAALAWFVARTLRSAAQSVFDLAPGARRLLAFGDPTSRLRPATVHDGRRPAAQSRSAWSDDDN
jgi:hypothetical protein